MILENVGLSKDTHRQLCPKFQARERSHLHADLEILEHLIQYRNSEFGMVPLEVVDDHGKEGDAPVLDLPDLGKGPEKVVIYLSMVRYISALCTSHQVSYLQLVPPNEVCAINARPCQ